MSAVISQQARELLPPNASALELACVEALLARPELPDTLARLQDYATCPEEFLPFLAWERSVDVWDDDWPVERKRAVIAAAPEVHRRKGTIGAVKKSLQALGLGATVHRWFEHGGDPHTIRVALDITDQQVDLSEFKVIAQSVERSKSAHTLLERFDAIKTVPVGASIGATAGITLEVSPITANPFADWFVFSETSGPWPEPSIPDWLDLFPDYEPYRPHDIDDLYGSPLSRIGGFCWILRDSIVPVAVGQTYEMEVIGHQLVASSGSGGENVQGYVFCFDTGMTSLGGAKRVINVSEASDTPGTAYTGQITGTGSGNNTFHPSTAFVRTALRIGAGGDGTFGFAHARFGKI